MIHCISQKREKVAPLREALVKSATWSSELKRRLTPATLKPHERYAAVYLREAIAGEMLRVVRCW